MMVQSRNVPMFNDYQNKGTAMKQRYEEARKKLMKYQDQIAQCYSIKKSMENDFKK